MFYYDFCLIDSVIAFRIVGCYEITLCLYDYIYVHFFQKLFLQNILLN